MDIIRVIKFVGISLGLIISSCGAFSQTIESSGINDIPKIVPSSPEAASLGKYGQIPVSYYRGVPDISLPLFAIKEGKIRLPIGLSYHAGGIKVEEMAPWVGTGWALNAGGVITRSLKGLDDLSYPEGFRYSADTARKFYNKQMTSSDSINYLLELYRKDKDGEPDIFNYNFGGISGQFFYRDSGKIVATPRTGVKIEYNDANNGWVITDGNGIKYSFFAREYTATEPFCKPQGGSYSSGDAYNIFSAWYLTRIDDPNGNYVIFTYGPGGGAYQTQAVETYNLINGGYVHSCPAVSVTCYNQVTIGGYQLKEISYSGGRITFEAGTTERLDYPGNYPLQTVTQWNTDSQVVKSYKLYTSNFNTNTIGGCFDAKPYRLRLDSVHELGTNGVSIPPYKFSYNTNGSLPCRLSYAQDYWGYYNGQDNSTFVRYKTSLTGPYVGANKEVDTTKVKYGMLETVTYPTGGRTEYTYEVNRYPTGTTAGYDKLNPTAFESLTGDNINADDYIVTFTKTISIPSASIPPPGYRYITVAFTKHCDNPTLINIFTMTIAGANGYSKTLHDGDTLHLTAGNYTLSGSIETEFAAQPYCNFVLQLNEFPYTNGYWQNNPYGGLRIRQIRNFSAQNDTTDMQTFFYNIFDSAGNLTTQGSGDYTGLPNPTYYEYDKDSKINFDASGGNQLQNCPYRVYNAVSNYPLLNTGGTPIGYTNVTVLHGPNGANGKEQYVFTGYFDYPFAVSYTYPYFFATINDWRYGLQTMKATYSYENGSYVPVEKKYTVYEFHDTDTTHKEARSILVGKMSEWNKETLGQDMYDLDGLGFMSYPTYAEALNVKSDTTITYDKSSTANFVKQTNTYVYNPRNFQLQQKVSDNSKNEVIITNLKYPLDYTISGIPNNNISKGLQNLQNNYIINAVVEQTTQKATSPGTNVVTLHSMLSTYKPTAPNPDTIFLTETAQPLTDFAPTTISGSAAVLDTRYKPKIYFDKYDAKGNTIQQRKAQDVRHNYIWDYKKNYPIAEVLNSDSASIAYSSFEADGTGDWSIGSSSRNTGGAVTGNRWYTLSSNISKAGLNSAATYNISYWTKNVSSFSIAGTISGYPVRGNTVNGWTFYLHRVTGQSTITINGSGSIDELRLCPAAALMTTYTYQPLVGMTSQCDATGKITYYEYDGLQRLLRIRDMDGNIVKQFEYQYQSSASCGSNCYVLSMTNLAGANTLSYPVGVFNANGKLLDTASNQARFIAKWNADTANANRGVLSAGADSMHFQLTLNAGKALPAITGCRFYKVDLSWNQFDGVRNINGCCVDFGDGASVRLAANPGDSIKPLPANTIQKLGGSAIYLVHTYADTTTLKTLTFYHNDGEETQYLDNVNAPATSLSKLKNLRGNLPQHIKQFGSSSNQQASMSSVVNVINWASIHSINDFHLNTGDGGTTTIQNLSYQQDFMGGNPDLQSIQLARNNVACYFDSTFKISRLKSDWNTWFKHLQFLSITDAQWSREDLSALKELNYFYIIPKRPLYSNDPTGNAEIPIPQNVVNNIFIQIASGSGQTVSGGFLYISSGGSGRSSASDAAVTTLLAKGWALYLDGQQLH